MYQMPIIPKPKISDEDINNLLLIGFDKAKADDAIHTQRMVHFFLYDYKFERVWEKPDIDIQRLKNYRAVLSPDFSMYLEMAQSIKIYNTFCNRWCGAYWASKGINVIPTINWGDESTFDFCFDGIEKGSIVAVSTYMASEHDNRKDQKDWFLNGYNEMLKRIDPEKIICYNTPFDEMQGNIITVDYELSSWRHMNYHKTSEDLSVYKIHCTNTENYDTINSYKIGENSNKGGGSAFGGEWQPSKPKDERFLGEPGEVKVTYDKNGYKIETKIGDDGRAAKERHHTHHGNPKIHSNPHDHIINWQKPKPGKPNFVKPHINYPNGAPEFKWYIGDDNMANKNYYDYQNTAEENRFKTISEFEDCMIRGGEVEFTRNGKSYSITHYYDQIHIGEAYKEETEMFADTVDEALEYIIDGVRLRDIITEIEVIHRTL